LVVIWNAMISGVASAASYCTKSHSEWLFYCDVNVLVVSFMRVFAVMVRRGRKGLRISVRTLQVTSWMDSAHPGVI